MKKALDNRWSRVHSAAQGSGGPRILPMLAVLGEAAGERWQRYSVRSSYASWPTVSNCAVERLDGRIARHGQVRPHTTVVLERSSCQNG